MCEGDILNFNVEDNIDYLTITIILCKSLELIKANEVSMRMIDTYMRYFKYARQHITNEKDKQLLNGIYNKWRLKNNRIYAKLLSATISPLNESVVTSRLIENMKENRENREKRENKLGSGMLESVVITDGTKYVFEVIYGYIIDRINDRLYKLVESRYMYNNYSIMYEYLLSKNMRTNKNIYNMTQFMLPLLINDNNINIKDLVIKDGNVYFVIDSESYDLLNRLVNMNKHYIEDMINDIIINIVG